MCTLPALRKVVGNFNVSNQHMICDNTPGGVGMASFTADTADCRDLLIDRAMVLGGSAVSGMVAKAVPRAHVPTAQRAA